MKIDYISREAAKEKCCSLCRWEGTSNCDECEHPIDDIPAADVRPVVRGKWKFAGSVFPMYECDQCRAISLGGNFCPNCGADMREES